MADASPPGGPGGLPAEVAAHYDAGGEARRLFSGGSRIEYARTQEILARVLPPPPATILDVGGGPGAYALWLARAGYAVTLIDALPLHVAQAQAESAAQPDAPAGRRQRGRRPPPGAARRLAPMPCCSSARSTT